MLQSRPCLTHSNANVMLVEAQISELMSLFLSSLGFYILECYLSNLMAQNGIIHRDSMFLAGAWPSRTKPAQPQIDTCAILSLNGKPELSSDSSIQKAIKVEA